LGFSPIVLGIEQMGVYYKCLCGDSEHLAVMERDAVAIRDSSGRTWICYPIEPRKVENLTMLAHVSEVFQADATARRHGIAQQGTEVRIYYCEDEHELIEKLLFNATPEN
jgi:hypothetical protein